MNTLLYSLGVATYEPPVGRVRKITTDAPAEKDRDELVYDAIENGNQTVEDIADELRLVGTTVRPCLLRLIAAGRVKYIVGRKKLRIYFTDKQGVPEGDF